MTPAPSRIAHFYGYAVCLIAVITMLISVGNLADAVIDRGNPLLAGGRYGHVEGSLLSFEAYRASVGAHRMPPPGREGAASPGDTLTTAELRARYEALRADQLARVRFGTTQRIVKHGLLLVIALALFGTHWRWLRTRDASDGRAARDVTAAHASGSA